MHNQQTTPATELTRATTLERLGAICDVTLRALSGLILLIFAAIPLMKLTLVTLRATHGGQQALFQLVVTIAAAISIMVGCAVLAGLPLRSVSRTVQGGVLFLAVFLMVLFSPRTSTSLDEPMASHHVTTLLIALAIAGVSWYIIRKPRLSVAHTAMQATGMVIVGTALMFLV